MSTIGLTQCQRSSTVYAIVNYTSIGYGCIIHINHFIENINCRLKGTGHHVCKTLSSPLAVLGSAQYAAVTEFTKLLIVCSCDSSCRLVYKECKLYGLFCCAQFAKLKAVHKVSKATSAAQMSPTHTCCRLHPLGFCETSWWIGTVLW